MQDLLKNRDLYSAHRILIPVPHFAVFYNGVSDRPAIETIKLSSSYDKPTDEPELELTCTIYNINPDKGKELLGRCAVLDEYTRFVETVRRFNAEDNEEYHAEVYPNRRKCASFGDLKRRGHEAQTLCILYQYHRRCHISQSGHISALC